METFMKCGHTAQGYTTVEGKEVPCCVICGVTELRDPPSLDGRLSRCSDCGQIVASSYSLPFFRIRENEKYDTHYDGCRGWD